MTNKRMRIAMTDKKLLEQLKKLHEEPEYIYFAADALGEALGKVEVFLLDDETAIRFLGSRAEANWPSVIVYAEEGKGIPSSFRQGIVDDLLVLPARALDLERMLRTSECIQALRALEESSHGVTGLVKQLQEDVSLAQKIQRRLIREKFPALGPVAVKSKYWCGLKSGGDYFDLFEFPGNSHAGLILSDSSSYSLSTGLIGSLIQFSVHVGRDELENPDRIVGALFGKLRESMKEKDQLSLLYAILDRKTYRLRYVACGQVFLAKRSSAGVLSWGCRGEHGPLSLAQPGVPEARELQLEPGDRLLLCSDGWAEALEQPMAALMEGFLAPKRDAQDLINEMAFTLRRQLEKESEEPLQAEDEFPMPPEDCSALVLDIAENTLRLAVR